MLVVYIHYVYVHNDNSGGDLKHHHERSTHPPRPLRTSLSTLQYVSVLQSDACRLEKHNVSIKARSFILLSNNNGNIYI